jgi:hypothetical protein
MLRKRGAASEDAGSSNLDLLRIIIMLQRKEVPSEMTSDC